MFFEHVMINNYSIPKVYENSENIRKFIHAPILDDSLLAALSGDKGFVWIEESYKLA